MDALFPAEAVDFCDCPVQPVIATAAIKPAKPLIKCAADKNLTAFNLAN
jgi:hypothetical protein